MNDEDGWKVKRCNSDTINPHNVRLSNDLNHR